MARAAANQGLTPSVLDRLIDPDSLGTSWMRGYSPQQMMEVVRRDLEDMFNSHQSDTDVPETYTELRNSIEAFGLPDLPSLVTRTSGHSEAIRRAIAEVIARFEPRLRDVVVTLHGSGAKDSLRARFHIEARLNVDPSPEVTFETVVELTTGHTQIRAGGP
jgi:type VI secretion system protein ImpF